MKLSRYAVLLYSALTYVFFLATYVYCIGFVTGLVVPRHIDTLDGAPPSLGRALAVNAGLLGLFAIQHTIMARFWFKAWITRWIPQAAERTTFVLATCSILCATFLFWQPMPGVLWEIEHPVLRAILHTVSVAGFLGVVYTSFIIDHFDLFGLKPAVMHFLGRTAQPAAFQVRSLYRYSRHPLYLFLLFAFWSAPTMTLGRLVFALLCTGYIFVGVRFEERNLVQEHGELYRAYRRRLPMVFPRMGRPVSRVEPRGNEMMLER